MNNEEPTVVQVLRTLVQYLRIQMLGPSSQNEEFTPEKNQQIIQELDKQMKRIKSESPKNVLDILEVMLKSLRLETEQHVKRVEGLVESAIVEVDRLTNDAQQVATIDAQQVATIDAQIAVLQAKRQAILSKPN
jgi:hypothetical protein